jgi:hypothetical protein
MNIVGADKVNQISLQTRISFQISRSTLISYGTELAYDPIVGIDILILLQQLDHGFTA